MDQGQRTVARFTLPITEECSGVNCAGKSVSSLSGWSVPNGALAYLQPIKARHRDREECMGRQKVVRSEMQRKKELKTQLMLAQKSIKRKISESLVSKNASCLRSGKPVLDLPASKKQEASTLIHNSRTRNLSNDFSRLSNSFLKTKKLQNPILSQTQKNIKKVQFQKCKKQRVTVKKSKYVKVFNELIRHKSKEWQAPTLDSWTVAEDVRKEVDLFAFY